MSRQLYLEILRLKQVLAFPQLFQNAEDLSARPIGKAALGWYPQAPGLQAVRL